MLSNYQLIADFYNIAGFYNIPISDVNPLSANPEKWSNTLKQIVGNLPTICLSVFEHFMNLALKGLKNRCLTFLIKKRM